MDRILNKNKLLFVGLFLVFGLMYGVIVKHEQIIDLIRNSGDSVYRNSQLVRPPMEIGEGGRSKYAYVKMSMFFKVHNDADYIDLFQTDDYNKGARFEVHNSEAAFVVANSHKAEGYDIYVIPEKIVTNRWYRLEVEVQNKGYVIASLDGKQICNVIDPGVFASMRHLVIGSGFDKTRIFNGDIEKVEIRTGDWPSFLVNMKLFKHHDYDIYLDKLSVKIGDLPTLLLKLKQFNYLNYEIYARLLASVIVFFVALIFWRRGQKNNIEKRIIFVLKEKQLILVPVFIVIQLMLMWSFEAYLSVVSGYALLFFMGSICSPLILPADVMRLRSIYVIYPVIGMILLSILGGYLIGYSVSPSLYVAICVICVAMLLLINITLNRNRFMMAAEMVKEDAADILIYGTVLITPVVLFLVYPILAIGYSTSVYRVGPDLMQYTKMAEYLMNGGTLLQSKMRASEFTGMMPGDMNRYTDATMSWPLMNYFRWGLTFYQVMIGKIIGVSHSYQIAFVSMVVPYLLEAGMVYVWLRKIYGTLIFTAYSGFLLVAFNVNILNLWYEGFLGNTYANVMFLWIIMLLAVLMEKEDPVLKDRSQFALMIGVVIAALFLSYGEVLLLVFPVFLFMVIVAELLAYRNIRWWNYIILITGGMIGLVIVLPCNYLSDWVVLTLKQLLQEGGNGYPQPLWAMPHDILGYGDIYSYLTIDKAGKPMERTVLDTLFGLPLMVVVMTFMISDIVRDERRSKVLKIVAMMIIMIVGLLVFKKSPHNNYTYMKMYVLFAPILVISFVSGVERWSRETAEWEGTHMIRLLFITLPVILNGLMYAVQYISQETVIERKQMVLAKHVREINFENVLMVPYNLGVKRVIYTAIMPGMWAVPEYWNQKTWRASPYYRILAGKKLYLIAEKERNVGYKVSGDVVLDDGSYLIVDSRMKIEDILCKDNVECNFDVAMRAVEEKKRRNDAFINK